MPARDAERRNRPERIMSVRDENLHLLSTSYYPWPWNPVTPMLMAASGPQPPPVAQALQAARPVGSALPRPSLSGVLSLLSC